MRSATRKRLGRDKAYLDWIRSLYCAVCMLPWKISGSGVAYSNVQQYPTEAAHVGDRGLSQKCSDRETIPLCALHHRLGPQSHHRAGKKFWRIWNLDRDKLIREYRERFEMEVAA